MIRDELRRKRKRAILGECPILGLQGYEDIDCQQAVVHFEGEGLVIETDKQMFAECISWEGCLAGGRCHGKVGAAKGNFEAQAGEGTALATLSRSFWQLSKSILVHAANKRHAWLEQ